MRETIAGEVGSGGVIRSAAQAVLTGVSAFGGGRDQSDRVPRSATSWKLPADGGGERRFWSFRYGYKGKARQARSRPPLTSANQLTPRPAALVVTRGGGSLEDLASFNDETRRCARFLRRDIPVVSAIGHEIDVTLADLVADLRALTPSEAAERVLPSADELRDALRHLGQRLNSGLRIGYFSAAKRVCRRSRSGGC